MSFSFSSCNLLEDLDDELGDNFLEKYDGITWVNENNSEYIRLNSDYRIRFESWNFIKDLNCYNFYTGSFRNIEYFNGVTIDQNKVIFKGLDWSTGYGETISLSISVEKDKLKIMVKNTITDEGYNLYFNEVNVDINTLEICK